MKLLVIGGGPAGLSFAALAAKEGAEVAVLERNAVDESPGWGVTVRDHALGFLDLGHRLRNVGMLEGRRLWYRGEVAVDLPNPPSAKLATIARSSLIGALADACREAGVVIRFGVDASTMSEADLAAYDLVVASDGANSAIRRRYEDVFRPTIKLGRHRYTWLGAEATIPKLTIMLRDRGLTLLGWAYRYAKDRSTFIVECTDPAWQASELARASPERTCAILGKAFAAELDGRAVLAGTTVAWHRYQTITCETLHHRNVVLIGDAAHTTHFSQGFGTMFAFDDALSLAQSLRESSGDVGRALAAYDAIQRPKTTAFQATAAASMVWTEDLVASAEAHDEEKVRALIAARWPDNAVTASPLETTARTR